MRRSSRFPSSFVLLFLFSLVFGVAVSTTTYAADTDPPTTQSISGTRFVKNGGTATIEYQVVEPSGSDASGLKKVELWYKNLPSGQWTYSTENVSSQSAGVFTYTGPTTTSETKIAFAVVGEDNAGNRTALPTDTTGKSLKTTFFSTTLTPSKAKTLPNSVGSETVTIEGIVTAAGSGYFYIEDENRIGGIRVETTATLPAVGCETTVVGSLKTKPVGVGIAKEERYLQATNVTTHLWNQNLYPLAMANRTLGGGDFYCETNGAGQKGATTGFGWNNIGLLVRSWGKVTSIGVGCFWIDDGSLSGVDGGVAGACSTRVETADTSSLTVGSMVCVNGISTTYTDDNGVRHRQIINAQINNPAQASVTLNVTAGTHLIAPPLVPINSDPASVFANFKDASNNVLNIDGNLTRLDPYLHGYTGYSPDFPDYGGVILTDGAWLYNAAAGTWQYTGVKDSIPDANGRKSDVVTSLAATGDIIIGYPFNHPTKMITCRVTDGLDLLTIDDAANAGWMNNEFIGMDDTGSYTTIATCPEIDEWAFYSLEPSHGYWVSIFKDNLALVASPDRVAPTVGSVTSPNMAQSSTITVSYAGVIDDNSGLASAELWYRKSSDLAWQKYAECTNGESAGSFSFTAPESGVYFFAIEAVDKAGNRSTPSEDPSCVVSKTYFGNTPTPSILKLFSDSGTNESVTTVGIVTAKGLGYFYIEDENRIGGIRVETTETLPYVNCKVTVAGSIKTKPAGVGIASQERYIQATSVTTNLWDSPVSALAMPNRSIGGRDFYCGANGEGQKGVTTGFGWNNIGLLVRTWGEVKSIDLDGSLWIDDGSVVSIDGLAYESCGVRVENPVTPSVVVGDFICVTGISTSYTDADGISHRQIINTRDVTVNPATATVSYTLPSGTSMISTPVLPRYSDPSLLFKDNNGDPIMITGYLCRWDALWQSYLNYSLRYPEEFGGLLFGDGTFMYADTATQWQYMGLQGSGIPGGRNSAYDIAMSLPIAGANMVGQPFSYPTKLATYKVTDGIEVRSISDAYDALWFMGGFTGLDENGNYFDVAIDPIFSETTGNVDPFHGYWISSYKDNVALIVSPDRVAPTVGSVTSPSMAQGSTITVSYADVVDDNSGLAKVELWYKKSSDFTWTKVAECTDGQPTGSFSFAVSGNGLYFSALLAEDKAGNKTSLQASADGACSRTIVGTETTLGMWKAMPDSAAADSITATGVVTAVYAADGYFYIEDENRTSGIRVQKSSPGVAIGDEVIVTGKMKTRASGVGVASEERYIEATDVTITSAGTANITPLGMTNSALGGTDFLCGGNNAGQKGVDYASGWNNIGLLVRSWGRVSSVGTGYLVIEDRSTDYSYEENLVFQYSPTRVTGPGLPTVNVGQYVCVTGISSSYTDENGARQRTILTRDVVKDITVDPVGVQVGTSFSGVSLISAPLVPLNAELSQAFGDLKDPSGSLIDPWLMFQRYSGYGFDLYLGDDDPWFGGVVLGGAYFWDGESATWTYTGLPDGVPDGDGIMTDMAIPSSLNGGPVGTPFNHPTKLSKCKVTNGVETLSWDEAATRGWIEPGLYSYDGVANTWEENAVTTFGTNNELKQFEGYWVANKYSADGLPIAIVFSAGLPFRSSEIGVPPTVATPEFTPDMVVHYSPHQVSITCDTPGATIYYTTMGETPTRYSMVYYGPVWVSAGTTLKAIAVKDGYTDSEVKSATYMQFSGYADLSVDSNDDGVIDSTDGSDCVMGVSATDLKEIKISVYPNGRGINAEILVNNPNVKLWTSRNKDKQLGSGYCYHLGYEQLPTSVWAEGASPGESVVSLRVVDITGGFEHELARDEVRVRVIGIRFSYGPDGSKTISHSNGISTTYTFDERYRLKTVEHRDATHTVAKVTYGSDGVGNRTSMTVSDGVSSATTSYGYDAINRLTSATYPGQSSPVDFIYDWVGNRLNAGSDSYSYDIADRLVSHNNSPVYGYWGTGSLQSFGPLNRTFAYDERELLSTVHN